MKWYGNRTIDQFKQVEHQDKKQEPIWNMDLIGLVLFHHSKLIENKNLKSKNNDQSFKNSN